MGDMARKIVKVDVDNLLRILNEAFAEEWLAYYQYWLGGKLAVGPERYVIEKEFEEHAGEELKHAEWLVDRIIQLGGTPVVSPNEWINVAKCKYSAPINVDVVTLLKENLEAERCAIGRYQGICDLTEGKDHETYRVARKILKEEIEHEQELEDFLADIEEAKKSTGF